MNGGGRNEGRTGGRTWLFGLFAKIHENHRWRLVVIFALFPLFLVSLLFRLVVCIRVFFYRVGLFRSERLGAYVINVGNLTAGGAGKTPVVMHIAEMFKGAGINTAVISRGYGFNVKGDYLVVSDREGVKRSPGKAPDEALMTARRLTGTNAVPVIVGPERTLSGRAAVDKYNAEVVIMDDGYQHLRVRRDMNILVFDGENPLGNGLMLPVGPLREPLKASKRADVVWINDKSGSGIPDTKGLEGKLKRYLAGGIPVVKSTLVPESILAIEGNTHPVEIINKKRVLAFSGIARPASFFKTLDKIGAIVVCELPFLDHYFFTEDDFKAIERMAFLYNAEMLVTTEKDMARISADRKFRLPIFALVMSLAADGDKAVFDMAVSGLGLDGGFIKK